MDKKIKLFKGHARIAETGSMFPRVVANDDLAEEAAERIAAGEKVRHATSRVRGGAPVDFEKDLRGQ